MAKLDFDRSVAVVIGIDQYGGGIAPLRTAVSDAGAVAELLGEAHSYEVQLLLDGQATKQQLQVLVRETLPGLLTERSRLLFYFAGHGIAQDGEDGPAGYLIPQDAQVNEAESYLPMRWLHDELTQLPCKHFLAIFDCCFAGAFRWSSTRRISRSSEVIHQERFDRFQQDPAWQVITSASYDQEAWDIFRLADDRGEVSGQHSPFAAALMGALRGAADTSPPAMNGRPAGDGVITATELYTYLRDQVEAPTAERRKRQTPELCALKRHDKGEFIFLTPGHELNLPPAPKLKVENNPYRGLESFDQAHRKLFFGRDEEIKRLLAKVKAMPPLTIVLGASGTGKSSLVKAGLLPRLARQDWAFELLPVMRPGERPLEALARAVAGVRTLSAKQAKSLGRKLARDEQLLAKLVERWQGQNPGKTLVLVVDQAEELVTQCQEETEAKQFQRLLTRALEKQGQRFRVLVTLRLDFEAQFQQEEWKSVWMASRFVVPPMTQAQLREAIEKPATERVLYFEPSSLVDRLVEDVGQTPGALPLLSFTLSELYLRYLERRSDNRALTAADYEALGGVTGSLTQRATQEYEALVAEDGAFAQTVKHVMLRMVAVEGGELARRRVPRSELVYGSEVENERVQRLLDKLIAARLVVQGQEGDEEPYVEPAHDALVRGWDKLLRWKNEEQVSLVLQRELTPQAWNWQVERVAERRRKARGYLWNGNPRLGLLKEVWESEQSWLNAVETNFVKRSLQRKRNLTGQLIGIGLAVIGALSGLAIRANNNAALAEKNAEEAGRQEKIAKGNAEKAEASAAEAKRNAEEAKANEIEAEKNLKEANKQQKTAEKNLEEAQRQEDIAERNATEAEKQTDIAKKEANRANVQTKVAEEQQYLAETRQEEAEEARNAEAKQRQVAEEETIRAVEKNITALSNSSTAFGLANQNLKSMVAAVKAWQQVENAGLEADKRALTAKATLMKGAYENIDVSKRRNSNIKDFSKFDFREKNYLKRHNGWIIGITVHPDGKGLVSIGADNTIKFWNMQGRLLKTISGTGKYILSVAYSPDGKILATGNYDGNISLWNDQGKLIRTLTDYGGEVYGLTFSPNSKVLASGSYDGTIKLWDKKGNLLRVLSGHTPGFHINGIAFSPDGKTIASASADKTVRLWDKRGNLLHTLNNHREGIQSVVFSPDGETIASASTDRTIRLWDRKGNLLHTLTGHTREVNDIAFSPDSEIIASASTDETVKLWDRQGNLLETLRGHSGEVRSIAFHPNGETVFSSSHDGTVKLWAKPKTLLQTSISHGTKLTSVVFSPDSKTVASASVDGTVKLWNQKGVLLKTFLHQGKVNSVLFSPDGKTIASAGDNKKVQLWSREGKILKSLIGHDGNVNSLAFSGDGTILASASDDGAIKVWDRQGSLLRTISRQDVEGYQSIKSIAFSPDGEVLASAGYDQTVNLWNMQGKLLSTLKGHSSEVRTVAFSPNRSFIASADINRLISLWDRKGNLLKSFVAHKGGVLSVTYSQNSNVLASSSSDGSIKLWDVQGNLLNTMNGHSEAVTSLAFSPDGQLFASASADGNILLWDLEPRRILDWHCNWLSGYLLYNPDGKKARSEGVCKGRI